MLSGSPSVPKSRCAMSRCGLVTPVPAVGFHHRVRASRRTTGCIARPAAHDAKLLISLHSQPDSKSCLCRERAHDSLNADLPW